jgi:hypothetical protein
MSERTGDAVADDVPSGQAQGQQPASAGARTPFIRSRAMQLAAAAWLGFLGLAATIVGGHDAVAGLEIGVRLIGTLVLAAGLVLVVAAVGLLTNRPYGRSLAMVGALLGVALGVMTTLSQVVNDEPDSRLSMWATIIALSALAAVVIYAQTPQDERGGSIWSRLPILKSVVSVGILFSVGQFWYSSIYLPGSAPPSLTMELRLEPAGRRDGRVALNGTATIKNTSGTKISTLASVMQVWGWDVAAASLDEATFMDAIRASANPRQLILADRYAQAGQPRLVHQQRLLADGAYFEPGETSTVPIVTWVPENRFRVVQMSVGLAVARGRTLPVEVSPEVSSGKDSVVTLTRVPEAGWLRSLTRDDRFVRAEWAVDPSAPGFRVWIARDRERRPARDFHERMTRLYGLSYASAEALVPFWERSAAPRERG